MTEFQNKSFSVYSGTGETYRDNWDRIFKKKDEPECWQGCDHFGLPCPSKDADKASQPEAPFMCLGCRQPREYLGKKRWRCYTATCPGPVDVIGEAPGRESAKPACTACGADWESHPRLACPGGYAQAGGEG